MIGRVLYGLLFIAVVPAMLVAWTMRLEPSVSLPAGHWPVVGAELAALGLVLMAGAMVALRFHGGGLPMNAFPPPRYVTRGVYRVLAHPIYVGFGLVCFGVSAACGSAAGLWVVSPVAALGCAALVLGYEGHDLRRRFGATIGAPVLSLPARSDGSRTWGDIWSIWVLVLAPWLVLYEAVGHIPVPHARVAYGAAEGAWRVLPWTEAVYASVYPLVVLCPLALRTRSDARRFMIDGWVGIVVGLLCYVAIPLVSPPRPFAPEGVWGRLLALERADGLDGRAAFPAFHVFWAMMAARAYAAQGRWRRALAWFWAAAAAASCVTTGMHAVIDVLAGAVLFVVAVGCGRVWNLIRRGARAVCNSWREWRLGPVRVINHGVYAGAGAFAGSLLVCTMLGPGSWRGVAILAAASLVGACLWGQYWVGSRTYLRPFGYFGSILGGGAVLAAMAVADRQVWPLAAAITVAAPWVQGIGRLRCLVQGCCHGASAPKDVGIIYTRPESRVVRGGLGGVPVHATPLYSILWNVVIGIVLARMWCDAAPAPLIGGLYLVLAGLGRFVEESYRGEPHTPVYRGLRLYQWCAIGVVVVGIGASCLPSPPWIRAPARLDLGSVIAALVIGLAHLAAMGVDFPGSNRRFSRLA